MHEAVLRGVQGLEIGAIALAAVRWAMNTPGSRDLNDGLLTPLGILSDLYSNLVNLKILVATLFTLFPIQVRLPDG